MAVGFQMHNSPMYNSMYVDPICVFPYVQSIYRSVPYKGRYYRLIAELDTLQISLYTLHLTPYTLSYMASTTSHSICKQIKKKMLINHCTNDYTDKKRARVVVLQ